MVHSCLKINNESTLLVLLLTCSLLLLIIIVAYLYKWYIKNSVKRGNGFYLYSTLFIMVINLVIDLVNICDAYTSYQSEIKNEIKRTFWNHVKFIIDVLYFSGCTFLYINIVRRLYQTFKSIVFSFSLIILSVYVMFMYCYILDSFSFCITLWSK